MATVAFLDCFSGIAGDMLLGAMVDAGLSLEELAAELSRLPLSGYRLRDQEVRRAGLRATLVTVEVTEPQPPRYLPDILSIIDASSLPEEDKERGKSVFRLLAEAEGRVHGLPSEGVRLHEVGAADAIVDVMGAVVGLRLLGVRRLYASPLPLPVGEREGMPLPAPAVLQVLATVNAPTRPSQGATAELVTPTGAAIVAALAHFRQPALRLRAVGYGAGAADLAGRPNVLRLWLGEEDEDGAPCLVLLETNLDDMTGEVLAHVLERLLALGVNDAWLTPVQMKKGRPGAVLSVLCPEGLEEEAVRLLLRETTTLGVRRQPVGRWEAPRETFSFQSSLGPAAVKVKRLPGEPPRAEPEFEVCRRLAAASGLPLLEVYRIVQREGERLLRGQGPPSSGGGGRRGPSSARSPRRGRPSGP
ncbi:MAG TPA: nickel pincer cofactor biosynthesis protein LarC [Dehalococcoidia bacterium]|nr:nickel pincer cofactor biosynthesis protein LarC [Dehalococcoidia bacterium]